MTGSTSGNIYAFARVGNVGNVYRIAPDYSVDLLASGFGNAVSIAVDANENVYFADTFNRGIYKIDQAGNVDLLTTAQFSIGAITVTRSGVVLVAQWGGGVVFELGADGQFSQRFQINSQILYGLTEDSDGNIWTSNQNGGTVTRVSTSGVIDTYSGITTPGAMVSDGSGGVYVSAYQGIKHVSDAGLITNVVSHAGLASSYICNRRKW
jgi:sugar lactone lactonase YvrE